MGVVKEISIKDFVEEIGKEKYFKTHKKEVYEGVYNGLLKSIKPMAEASPVDTGLYASAWSVKKVDENNIFFGNTAPYAVLIEHGARPFMPPLSPLIAWASRQLQLPKDHPEVKQFAWAVAKKIEREGLEPRNVLKNGIEDILIPNIKKNLDKLEL